MVREGLGFVVQEVFCLLLFWKDLFGGGGGLKIVVVWLGRERL